ncbi:MAG: MotA/TolQ/ExbB proton channel family protein [Planctomycetes bacterium]|nr:MotA/TolQ/ExbB proton channel family protein [Planctomycetota bacterium]
MKSRILPTLALAFIVFVFAGSVAFAAEEGDTVHAKKTWWDLFKTTGLVGILIVGCSVTGVALTIENLVNLKEEKLAPPDVIGELEGLLEEGRMDEALQLCDSDKSYLGNVVAGGVLMAGSSFDEMLKGMEQAAAEETFKVNTKISYLSLLGNIAPLLGLLGTVTGMVSSFQEIEKSKSPTPADLAKGVYESLVNTTMGLFTAIVFLTVYFFLKNKVSRMTLGINMVAFELLKKAHTSQAGG